MIKVSVFYPNHAGATFDEAYYLDKHMPMVKERMGSSLKFFAVERGVVGDRPGEPPANLVMAHLVCECVEDFQRGFGPHTGEIMGDIANYTNVSPVMQISEVLVDHG